MRVQKVAAQQGEDRKAGDRVESAGHAQSPRPEEQGDRPRGHQLIPVRVAQPEPGARRVRRDGRILSVGEGLLPNDAGACSDVDDGGGRDHVGRLPSHGCRDPVVVQRRKEDLGVLGRGGRRGGGRGDRGGSLCAARRRVRLRS